MPPKKKKQKSLHTVPPAELLKLAEEQLQQGRVDEALENLRRAEPHLQPRTTIAGKKMSVPPHLAAAQAKLAPLLARALAARAWTETDPAEKLKALEEAAKTAPDDVRYRLGIGACRLLLGAAARALAEFEQAAAAHPDDERVSRARALGLLANERTREAGEVLRAQPATQHNAHWQRLLALRALFVGHELPANSSGNQLLRGVALLAAGEHERARAALAELPALTHNPTQAEAAQIATQFFYSGALNFTARQYSAAIGEWREAQRLLQTHQLNLPWRDRLVVYFNQTAAQVAAESLPLALECWQCALQLAPHDKTAQANLSAAKRAQALRLWRAGESEQAVALWQEALQAKPHDEQLLRNLAVATEKLGRKEAAVTHWRALAKVWRQQAKQRAGEADFRERLLKVEEHAVQLMLETGHPPEAVVSELEGALNFDPENVALRQRIIEQLLELGRSQPALKHLDAIEKQQGISADLLARRGMAQDLMGRTGDARKSFERALELEPDNALVRRNYLLLLGQEAQRVTDNGNYKRAIEVCQRQLALDPNYEPALFNLAIVYFAQKRQAEAIQMLDRVIASAPNEGKKYGLVGSIYLDQGMKKEAEAAFKKAVELDSSAQCLFNIGIAYWENEETKPALKYFDRAAETAPLEMLLDIAIHMVEADKSKEADRFLKKAMERDPAHPLPHIIKGFSLIGLGNPLMMLLGIGGGNLKEAGQSLAEAERLMAGRPDYEEILPTVRQIRQALETGQMPGLGGLLGGLGPPPFGGDFFADDDDFDPFFAPPVRRKKKRRK